MKVILAFLVAILGYLVLDHIFKTIRLGKWSMVMKWMMSACSPLIYFG